MNISLGAEFAAKPHYTKPNRWTRFALLFALALAPASFGGATSALAATLGAGAIVDIFDPLTEQSGVFIASDPAGLLTVVQRLLVPEGEAYTAGNTSAAISLSRSTTGLGGTGMGSAAVDSPSGTLRVFSTASGDAITFSAAGLSDSLMPLATGFHQYTLTVEGVANGDARGSGAFFAVDNAVWLGTRGEPDADGCFATLNGVNKCVYVFDVPVTAGVPVVFVVAIVAEAMNSSLDLTQTATLRVTGVPFTSASGVFLTAVPEPGVMLLLGSGWAGGLAWQRRRKAALRAD